jgi:hypothetical protein
MARCSQAKSLIPAIIAGYLIIFKPLMDLSAQAEGQDCAAGPLSLEMLQKFRNASSVPHTRFAP